MCHDVGWAVNKDFFKRFFFVCLGGPCSSGGKVLFAGPPLDN